MFLFRIFVESSYRRYKAKVHQYIRKKLPLMPMTHVPETSAIILHLNFNPLPSARQHPSYGDCLEVKGEYYQNSSVLDCVTMFTVRNTLM